MIAAAAGVKDVDPADYTLRAALRDGGEPQDPAGPAAFDRAIGHGK